MAKHIVAPAGTRLSLVAVFQVWEGKPHPRLTRSSLAHSHPLSGCAASTGLSPSKKYRTCHG